MRNEDVKVGQWHHAGPILAGEEHDEYWDVILGIRKDEWNVPLFNILTIDYNREQQELTLFKPAEARNDFSGAKKATSKHLRKLISVIFKTKDFKKSKYVAG